MNLNSYSSHYGQFHRCTVSSARNNVIAFDLAYSPYETFILSRMYPYDTIQIDCQKPFILALKAHFQMDVLASVICNKKYLFTICLGNQQMIYPVHRDLYSGSKLHLYATTYFVKDPNLVTQYMQGSIRPAYENVYFYKKTVLYLDSMDLPCPGRSYFDDFKPTSYYRLLFLTQEPLDYVLNLASEWGSRPGVQDIPFLTRDVVATPKFIHFQPIPHPLYSDLNPITTGVIEKNLSSERPWLLLQDILLSYYKRISTEEALHVVGIVLEWPLRLSYDGSRPPEPSLSEPTFVALTVNQNKPSRILFVSRPYDRYIVYHYIPPGPWTPIYFYMTSLITPLHLQKVVLDTVVIGLVYRETFFCFDRPLLEGNPKSCPTSNTSYLLSTLDFKEDSNITVLDTYKHDTRYALRRVRLKEVAQECWCLMPSEDSHPKCVKVPHLVEQWLDFFGQVKDHAFSVDVGIVRLALMLAKHNICFNMNAVQENKSSLQITEDSIHFHVNEKTVQFINAARLVERGTELESSQTCSVS